MTLRLAVVYAAVACAALIPLAAVTVRAEDRVNQWRDVANIDAHQLDVINQRCSINRVDGSATCPVGTFSTVKVAS